MTAIRTNAFSDTTLVQASCNYLNGESLVIDGAWGPLTDAAYERLPTKFKMQCRNPKTSVTDALLFLELIVKHGLKRGGGPEVLLLEKAAVRA